MTEQKLVFDSQVESDFYSQCILRFVFNNEQSYSTVIECGSGDGIPVIKALQASNYTGKVISYEINSIACETASINLSRANLESSYQVINESFFDVPIDHPHTVLISNPPFLPALSDNIIDPYLRGGDHGNEFTMQLIAMGYQDMVLTIASYTNPKETIDFALDQGYEVADFLVSPERLTFYSKDPDVYNQLVYLRNNGKGFFTENFFLLAGVLFKKKEGETRNEKSACLQKILSNVW